MLCRSAFPLVPALRSTGSAAFGSQQLAPQVGCPALFAGFIATIGVKAAIERMAPDSAKIVELRRRRGET